MPSPSAAMEPVSEILDEILGSSNIEKRRQEDAAMTIQRAWRKKVAARSRSKLFDPDTRWKDAAIHAQMQVDRQGADRGRNDPKTRWKRAAFLAARLQDDNSMYEKDTPEHGIPAEEKILETQHWLELVDAYVDKLLLNAIRLDIYEI
ncbi:hypothetical protein CONPUDRAFT_148852 [Coniophora puteana RWD-64-598 SS2]|uniref:Uncharacterized protein n=1 Tax=Coniophora puteana (strain RWD-64-598) TaxID=741705 RepID=A0A5M3N5W0_CONPW|nr:uncharacterized protein CONPUDRAFT_148852 [Coniophora puteana RWD-64-598 SS2]EIW86802.1 hypothetical protein CONPUDRAFT_148852 [Coniophora puteana RWD-64-598 SS2]